jgi:hypothetical protein
MLAEAVMSNPFAAGAFLSRGATGHYAQFKAPTGRNVSDQDGPLPGWANVQGGFADVIAAIRGA